jgi:hypothetical protein
MFSLLRIVALKVIVDRGRGTAGSIVTFSTVGLARTMEEEMGNKKIITVVKSSVDFT